MVASSSSSIGHIVDFYVSCIPSAQGQIRNGSLEDPDDPVSCETRYLRCTGVRRGRRIGSRYECAECRARCLIAARVSSQAGGVVEMLVHLAWIHGGPCSSSPGLVAIDKQLLCWSQSVDTDRAEHNHAHKLSALLAQDNGQLSCSNGHQSAAHLTSLPFQHLTAARTTRILESSTLYPSF